MNENQELIDLCTHCTKSVCPETGCSDYRAKKRLLEKGPKYLHEEKHAERRPQGPRVYTASALTKCSAVIDALEAFLADSGSEAFLDGTGNAAKRMLEHLKRTRFNGCADFVDWSAVAKQMEKEIKHE